MPFLHIHIPQGCVATYLRRGEIFKHPFVANLPLSPSVKKSENRLIFGEVMGKSLVSCFLTHSVVHIGKNALGQESRSDRPRCHPC